MPNAIKYSTTGDTQSLKKGNFYFGIGDVGKGPTSNTSYYNGVSPTTGGYTVYSYSSGQTSKISYYSANNDAQLITFTNGLSGQNFATASQCLNWYASQTDYVCVNRDYENIVTSGLTFNLDAGFTPSYPTTGTTWYDVSYSGNNGTLINSPIYNSTDGGSILFDGVDDYVSLGETLNLNTSSAFTISCVFKVVSYNNTYPTIFTLKTSIGNSLVLLLNSSGVYSPLTFGWNGSNTYKPTTSILTGVWNVLTLVYNGSGVSSSSNFNLYINNALLALSASSSLTGIGQVNSLGTLNTGVTSYWFNGNIPCIQIYNRSLSPSEVLQNYTAISSRFSSMDPDAQAFISAANITGSTQQGAINTLVVSLKGYGIWTKMKALYPFVGGTASQHKFNLKNPLDTDAAFRLVFVGGWTHSSTGALPNGTNAYADTKLNTLSNLTKSSTHLSTYLRNNPTPGQNYDIGNCSDDYGYDNTTTLISRYVTEIASFTIAEENYSSASVPSTDSIGFWNNSTNGSTTRRLFKNNSLIKTAVTSTGTFANNALYISAINCNNTARYFSNKETALVSIGDGLTDTEAANYFTSVRSFQTILGRQVGVPIVSDSDAQAFLDAAVITNTTEANAVNTLVISLKSYGVWTKMKALYPFVGGTATTHKFNLKNPLDTDAAFRLVFNGGWVHSTTGAKPNGTNAFANSFFNPATQSLSKDSTHIAYYRRNAEGSNNVLMSAMAGLNNLFRLNLVPNQFITNGNITEILSTDTEQRTASINDAGFINGNRNSSAEFKIFANATLKQTVARTSTGQPPTNIYIGAANYYGSINQYTNNECSFSSIGDGLTDTEAVNYYTAVQTFQTTLGRRVGVPIVSDSDAQAFLDAAIITGITEANAVNTLVISLKGYGVWTKMRALYPFVGGTATTHKFNLKNPLDTDAAFRLVFNGGWTHSSTGALPNGTNAYANTYYNPFIQTSVNDNSHICIYSRTNSSSVSVDIGSQESSYHILSLSRSDVSNNSYFGVNTNSNFVVLNSDTNTAAMYIGTRLGTTLTGWRNSTKVGTTTSAANTRPNLNFLLSAYNTNGSILAGWYSSKQLAIASIGDGLTDTEATNYYTAVEEFQSTLNRNVSVPTVSDSDAQAFLNATVITNQTQANSINTLVISLKSYGIWTKMKAVYPFVGGTATTHKFNLKNPLDTDAAFRLVFNGGWTHSATGALPNGTNAYADTKLNLNTMNSINDISYGYYCRTNTQSSGSFGWGVGGTAYNEFWIRYGGDTKYGYIFDSANDGGTAGGDCRGFNTQSRIASNVKYIQKNSSISTFTSLSTGALFSRNFIFSQGSQGYEDRENAFGFISNGLTNTELSNLYTAVQAFQTSLSRNV